MSGSVLRDNAWVVRADLTASGRVIVEARVGLLDYRRASRDAALADVDDEMDSPHPRVDDVVYEPKVFHLFDDRVGQM